MSAALLRPVLPPPRPLFRVVELRGDSGEAAVNIGQLDVFGDA